MTATRHRFPLTRPALTAYVATALLLVAGDALTQTGARPTSVIGGEQDRAVILENPRDIGVIGGKLLVLDANAPFLKLFDRNGSLLQRFVSTGGGPGEISAARRFTFDSVARELYTWDVMNVRANIYSLGDTLRFDRSLRLPAPMDDGCFLGRRLFVLGVLSGRLVHELEARDNELRVVRSFGVARGDHPLDGNPLYQFQVAKGRLACDPENQRVVAVSSYAGVAQIIDVRTGTQQTVKLNGLTPLTFAAQGVEGRAGVMQYAPENTFDYVTRVHVTPNGVRLLADRLGPEHRGNEDFSSVTEWTLLPSGELRKGGTSRQRDAGRVGDMIACFVGTPVPRIEIYRAARCP